MDIFSFLRRIIYFGFFLPFSVLCYCFVFRSLFNPFFALCFILFPFNASIFLTGGELLCVCFGWMRLRGLGGNVLRLWGWSLCAAVFLAGRCSARPGCAVLSETVVYIMPVIVEAENSWARSLTASYQRALCKNFPVSALENLCCGRGFFYFLKELQRTLLNLRESNYFKLSGVNSEGFANEATSLVFESCLNGLQQLLLQLHNFFEAAAAKRW